MKRLFKFLFLLMAGVLIINSCREDGEWEDNNTGVFGFTIDRDTDFIEKAVGETNSLKFDIKTKYDFATVPMKLKYTTTLNGVLMLDGKELEANKEYVVSKAENILEYVGNEAGTHELKISVKNDKEASLTEEFSLPYAISDFTVSVDGGKGDIYQSQFGSYSLKITPTSQKLNDEFFIKFINFDGNIKLNDVPVELNKDYRINDINLFNISLSSNKVGINRLDYEIKNNTVKRVLDIQHNVLARKLVIETISVSSKTVKTNTRLNIISLLSKAPQTDNKQIKYKTWVSSTSNGRTDGLENTNNVWMPYELTNNGSFSYEFLAKEIGNYTYNIQFQDEFGNLSEVSSFDISVNEALVFTKEPYGTMTIAKQTTSIGASNFYTYYYRGANINFSSETGVNNKIIKYKLDINFKFDNKMHNKTYTEEFNTPQEKIDINKEWQTLDKLLTTGHSGSFAATDVKFILIVYDTQGNTLTKEGSLTVNYNDLF